MEKTNILKLEDLVVDKIYKIMLSEPWIFQFKSFEEDRIYNSPVATLHDNYFDNSKGGYLPYDGETIYEATNEEIARFNELKSENNY